MTDTTSVCKDHHHRPLLIFTQSLLFDLLVMKHFMLSFLYGLLCLLSVVYIFIYIWIFGGCWWYRYRYFLAKIVSSKIYFEIWDIYFLWYRFKYICSISLLYIIRGGQIKNYYHILCAEPHSVTCEWVLSRSVGPSVCLSVWVGRWVCHLARLISLCVLFCHWVRSWDGEWCLISLLSMCHNHHCLQENICPFVAVSF